MKTLVTITIEGVEIPAESISVSADTFHEVAAEPTPEAPVEAPAPEVAPVVTPETPVEPATV